MSDPTNITLLTNGLTPSNSAGQSSSIISAGLSNLAAPAPPTPTTINTVDGVQPGPLVLNPANQLSTSTTIDVSAAAFYSPLETDPGPQSTSVIASVPYPSLAPNNFGIAENSPSAGRMSYAGVNVRALLEIGDNPSGQARYAKQLVELTTISISIHRAKSPASALGFIGMKGYARSRRTIAGTMVFTQFTRDVFFEFLNSCLMTDLSKDTNYVKVDQLPLFNMTLLFTNEYGYVSYRRLYGIDFLTDGTIYSVNDLMTEQTISYVASDFTPLMQLNTTNQYVKALTNNRMVSSELTPGQVLSSQNQVPVNTNGGAYASQSTDNPGTPVLIRRAS
jgi:hypothetical protein